MVYLLVGVFAILAAAGSGSPENPKGALQRLLDQPSGGVLLALVGLGLIAFAMWRFAQTFADTDHHGHSASAFIIRGALFGSALVHLALAAVAFSLILHFNVGGSGGSGQGGGQLGEMLHGLLLQSWGRVLAQAVALVPVAIGIAHIVKGVRGSYRKSLDGDPEVLDRIAPVCSFGLIARGAVFIVIGLLAFYGGGVYEAHQAPSVEDALAFLQGLPFGSVLFLATALGLVAFAAYCFVEAIYRRIGRQRA